MRIGPWILLLGAVGCGGDKDDAAGTGDTGGGETITFTADQDAEYIEYLIDNALTDNAAGKVLYEQLPGCAECHGVDGGGTADFPALSERLPLINNLRVAQVILDGIPAQPGKVPMPPYRADWTNEEMADVGGYIRATFAP